MREIIFRGKNKIVGWIYGGLTYADESFVSIHSLIYRTNLGVSADSVGQFTGLHDANESRIYEGDILSSTMHIVYEVIYDEKCACFKLRFTDTSGEVDTCRIESDIIKKFGLAVVGNITDNPELLNRVNYDGN